MGYNGVMSIAEIKTSIAQLPPMDLADLTEWFEEYQADLWDQQIERDAVSGRLDALAEQANREFEAREQVEVIVLPHAFPTPAQAAYSLRGTPVRYQEPLEPVAETDWETA